MVVNMATSQMYIETASGRKIGVMDVDSCVIIIQTASGKEVARMRGAELSLPSVIAKYHETLVAEYGSFVSAGKIAEITADEFSVHPAHVRRCVRQMNNLKGMV